MSNRKFILNSIELGRVTLNDDPLGWDTVKKVFNRNQKYQGIFRKRTTSIKFIGDGLDYCVELERLRGTEAILNVIIMVKKDYEDAWELEYEGIGKFNPFDLEWEDDLSPSLTIEFEDSGFHVKFINRADTLVDVGLEESAEGTALGAMPVKSIEVQQRQVEEQNIFELSEVNKYYWYVPEFGGPSTPPDADYIPTNPYSAHVIPAIKVIGETEFIETPIDYLLAPGTDLEDVIPDKICNTVNRNVAFKVRLKASGSGTAYKNDTTDAGDFAFQLWKFIDEFDLLVDKPLAPAFHTITATDPDGYNFTFNFDQTIDISLVSGEAFTIVFTALNGSGIHDIKYDTLELEIVLIQNFDSYVSKCHYRYEFMKRLVQLSTDQVDSFKSDIFGRLDLGYAAQGKWQNNVVFSGKQLRGFDEYPTWSFAKAFQSVRSIFNVGCGIEKFGSKFKVVVEDLPYFYSGRISITLHNVRGIKRGVNDEYTFSEVRVGYEKAEYEQVNGLEEYNNKCVFTTFIKSKPNTLDLISPERADGYGMEFARRKHISIAGSEDTQYDNEVFTAMVYEGDGTILRTQRNENYDSVENIQSPETAINLDITPQRNLLRNGDWVHGCVIKYPLEFTQFSSADKPTDLVSQRTGNVAVSEQTSIQNKDLISSLWLNKNYMFEADVEPWQVNKMENEPYRLIKFSPFSREQTKKYYYGWIIEVAVGGKERSGEFTLLAANIASDRLKLIDPDGIYDEDPTTPLPPSNNDYGFQYAFEHVFEG